MSTSQDMTEKEIWGELVNFTGGNEYAAAGIMGNLRAESNMNSTNLQNTYEKSLGMSDAEYTSRVDNGSYDNFVNDSAGYGLAQWTYNTRKRNLLNYARANNASIGSTSMQLSFLEKELSENYGSTLSQLKNANSVEEASNIFMTQFENPADQSSKAKANRASSGQKFYNLYSGSSAVTGTSTFSLDNSSGEASDLSDVTLNIQVDNLNDACSKWVQSVTQVDLASVDVVQVFSPLTDCQVAVSYIPSLKNALTQIDSLISSVSQIIKSAGDEQVNIDDAFQNQTGTLTNGEYTGGNNYTGNNNNNSNYTGGNTYYPSGGGTSSNPSTSVNNSGAPVEINTSMINSINSLDFKSYNSFMTALSSIVTKEISLTTYFSNSAYADILKKSLLESKSTPDSIKQIITNMDPNVLQATLYSLITDATVVTDISKSIMYTYLEGLANGSNLTLTDMFKNENALVKIFTDFNNTSNFINKVILSNDMNKQITNIYDGNSIGNIDSSNVNLIRVFVDNIASKKNVSVESLLNDSANNSYVKQSFEELGKAYEFMGNLGYTDLNTASAVLNNIFKSN